MMEAPRVRAFVDPLSLQLRIDRPCTGLVRVRRAPRSCEVHEVFSPAFGAGPMTCCKGRCFVQEEELREPARRHQRPAPAPFELQPACDPPEPVVRTSDSSRFVVEAAAVPVDEASRLGGNYLTERGDAIVQRHGGDFSSFVESQKETETDCRICRKREGPGSPMPPSRCW